MQMAAAQSPLGAVNFILTPDVCGLGSLAYRDCIILLVGHLAAYILMSAWIRAFSALQ